MYQLPILLKREFWEHKGIFLYFPLTISALVITLSLLAALVNVNVGGDVTIDAGDLRGRDIEWQSDSRPLQDIYLDQLQQLSRQDAREREEFVVKLLTSVSAPIRGTLWFVIFYYLLGSLYEDRKDRSVLFWKSMPVSDAMTVLSKLLAAAIVAPAIAFLFILVTQISILVIASVMSINADVSVWSTLWGPAQLYSYWPLLLAVLALQAFWSLPIYGFVMLVSCCARSVPLIWLLAVPAVIGLVEAMLMSGDRFADFFLGHLVPLSIGSDPENLRGWSDLVDISFSVNMGLGLLVGVALLFATIRLRGRSDEI
jgi:ABC-2 type transport system permease protein|tara:strand:- start:788 stop:1726 length:939 start_codon:yes stop_codon:yes gene_type:complete